MRKISFILVALFVIELFYSNAIAENEYSVSLITRGSSQEKFIDIVEAQDMYGDKTIYLKVYETVTANGKSNFYVKYKDERYEIDRIENNRYKPFYVKIGNERWYFASTSLDLYFVTRGQQKRI